jgi:hypothetical protein
MSESMFNGDQQAHAHWLDSLPAEQKCASGWHVLPEACTCERTYGFTTLAARNAATHKVGAHWFALPSGEGSDVGPFATRYEAEKWLQDTVYFGAAKAAESEET